MVSGYLYYAGCAVSCLPSHLVFEKCLACTQGIIISKGLVSKETVVLRRWGCETQKILDLSTELIR